MDGTLIPADILVRIYHRILEIQAGQQEATADLAVVTSSILHCINKQNVPVILYHS